jgi:hypothetical protein
MQGGGWRVVVDEPVRDRRDEFAQQPGVAAVGPHHVPGPDDGDPRFPAGGGEAVQPPGYLRAERRGDRRVGDEAVLMSTITSAVREGSISK